MKLLMLSIILLFCLSSCSSDLPISDPSTQVSESLCNDRSLQTKANDFHWTCPGSDKTPCGFKLNGGWQNYCSLCRSPYNNSHGNLILSFITAVKNEIPQGPAAPSVITVQLPNLYYPLVAPSPWYNTSKSLKYYDQLKTLYYQSNEQYRQGVDLGWYRATRSFYPNNTMKDQIKRHYDRFTISGGTSLKGPFGSGLKAGTKAAIDAFSAHR